MFGKNECLEALRAAVAVVEPFLELAGGGPAARVAFAAGRQPRLGKTDHHPAKQAQGKGGLGLAHPAAILAERDVQRMVQAALNDPVAAFELEDARRIQLVEGQAGDEVNDFGGLLAFAPDPAAQFGNGLNSGEAHLRRGDCHTIQHPDFMAAPVVFPGQNMGAHRGRRGKNAVGSTAGRGFQRVFFDFP